VSRWQGYDIGRIDGKWDDLTVSHRCRLRTMRHDRKLPDVARPQMAAILRTRCERRALLTAPRRRRATKTNEAS